MYLRNSAGPGYGHAGGGRTVAWLTGPGFNNISEIIDLEMKRIIIKTLVVFSCLILGAESVSSAASGQPEGIIGKTRSETFISGKNTAWQPAGDGVCRQIMGYDEHVMLVKVKFKKGAEGTPHTHFHTQTTYVVSGQFKFTVGDETKIVKAGDSIYIEPNILHGCVCLKPGMLVDCFSPMRSDFLK